ncbi:hypothetical protein MAR_033153 [Mya arenaria]|uniref:Claudin n=1 Tax=Mya arenaria TaxID=6604 RepID=A0ABY7GHI3_MYAAR|nr:uncharacterized protein LOC128224550 [Mya arenaria]WAR30611.1 hypothetical protein MAR_033153 [Mya arenaria]
MALLAVLVLIASTTAFLTAVVGLGVPVWSDTTNEVVETQQTVTTHTYSGLWAQCTYKEIKVSENFICKSYIETDVEGYTSALRASQAFSILGTAMAATCVVLAVIKLCILKNSTTIAKVLAVCAIIGAVFLFLSMIIYSTKVLSDIKATFSGDSDLTAGFALTIIAIALLIVVGIISCFVK